MPRRVLCKPQRKPSSRVLHCLLIAWAAVFPIVCCGANCPTAGTAPLMSLQEQVATCVRDLNTARSNVFPGVSLTAANCPSACADILKARVRCCSAFAQQPCCSTARKSRPGTIAQHCREVALECLGLASSLRHSLLHALFSAGHASRVCGLHRLCWLLHGNRCLTSRRPRIVSMHCVAWSYKGVLPTVRRCTICAITFRAHLFAIEQSSCCISQMTVPARPGCTACNSCQQWPP